MFIREIFILKRKRINILNIIFKTYNVNFWLFYFDDLISIAISLILGRLPFLLSFFISTFLFRFIYTNLFKLEVFTVYFLLFIFILHFCSYFGFNFVFTLSIIFWVNLSPNFNMLLLFYSWFYLYL